MGSSWEEDKLKFGFSNGAFSPFLAPFSLNFMGFVISKGEFLPRHVDAPILLSGLFDFALLYGWR